ncbi:MAG: MMPL family transporter [Planctomycetaceae bacterium]
MFRFLGHLASRKAPLIIALWVAILAGAVLAAPDWLSVAENGEFAFLPQDSPSRIAEQEFRKAFPEQSLASNVALVLRRETSKVGLQDSDRVFIAEVLIPRLREIVGFPEGRDTLRDDAGDGPVPPDAIVNKLSWYGVNPYVGDLYDSTDGQGSLIVMELRSEFLDQANNALIARVEDFLEELRREPAGSSLAIPRGLDIAFSGSATFGRDMLQAQRESARATERWTIILVVCLLLIIYRAPLLALIPLMTVAVATTITLKLLAIGAQFGLVKLFNGIEPYVTVLVYGAGVDYCLFLIARYREELDGGAAIEEAIAGTLEKIGSALAASAGTSMTGIGMMAFAEFGKFQQAGIAITFGFAVVLLAALSLTPAILRLLGRWAFWPNVPRQDVSHEAGWPARSDSFTRLLQSNWLQQGWHYVGQQLLKRPRKMWLSAVGGLLPFAMIGVVFYGYLSYGLLSELPDSAASVHGAKALQTHFAAGEMAPVDVILSVPGANFAEEKSGPDIDAIEAFTNAIVERKGELGLTTVRSQSAPKGQRDLLPNNGDGLSRANRVTIITGIKTVARNLYLSHVDPTVARIELVFEHDPFSRSSIEEFRGLRTTLPELLPERFKGASLFLKGETANISDLKDVTDRDQIRIDILVLAGVFAILWILLRKPGICAYLMCCVFFSYMAALGFTFFVFWAMDSTGFTGLDWKVPMFLFTILIAVGVDYNIFLMTRITEEQRAHGPVTGIIVALERTGSIISSCGIIMAGTFCSLLSGSLIGMDQLGLALAVGVLLDTFVVRPVLVPSFLILLVEGRLGFASRWAGFPPTTQASQIPT